MPTTPSIDDVKVIESQFPQMIKQLLDWVDINSFSDHLEGLAKMSLVLFQDFKILGGQQELINLPPRNCIDKHGQAYVKSVGKALKITKRSDCKRQVLLCGHMDSVYPADSPFQKGWIEGNEFHGPASADMKGGLMVMLKALELFESSPYAPNLGWKIVINPDEEIGSYSSEELLISTAKGCMAALIFEPAFSDGKLVCERKGSANFTAISRGRAAHAGRDFHEGKNAITALAQFVSEVHQLNHKFSDDTTINIGHIEGGGPVNIVPDLAICRFNVRSSDRKKMEEIERYIHDIALKSTEDGIHIDLVRNSYRPPKPFDDVHQQLFTSLSTVAKQLNLGINWHSSGGVCDGNNIAHSGVPTIDTLGVVGGGIHTEKEFFLTESLIERTKLTALFLMHLASK